MTKNIRNHWRPQSSTRPLSESYVDKLKIEINEKFTISNEAVSKNKHFQLMIIKALFQNNICFDITGMVSLMKNIKWFSEDTHLCKEWNNCLNIQTIRNEQFHSESLQATPDEHNQVLVAIQKIIVVCITIEFKSRLIYNHSL